MYDQNVGQFCSISTCKQKDWLPVRCKYCSKFYCAEHSSIQSHECPEYGKTKKQVYICPLCNKVIAVNVHLSVEENFSVHEAIECEGKYEEKTVQKCGVPKCKTKLHAQNEYTCKFCRKRYCLKHRMREDHPCIK